MTAAFRAAVTPTQKLVLLALCDCANDQGECYPSIPLLIDKCSLSERAVQKAIVELESGSYLRREFRNGRSTIYWMTPAAGAPPHDVHPAPRAPAPARRAPPPPHHVHPTPAPRAPITIKEPSEETSPKRKTPAVAAATLMAAGFDAATAGEFIAHKASVKAPLTQRAWDDHCAEARKAGWTPMAAAEKVMAKNWKGFEAKYVASEAAPGKTRKSDSLMAGNIAAAQRFLESTQ